MLEFLKKVNLHNIEVTFENNHEGHLFVHFRKGNSNYRCGLHLDNMLMMHVDSEVILNRCLDEAIAWMIKDGLISRVYGGLEVEKNDCGEC